VSVLLALSGRGNFGCMLELWVKCGGAAVATGKIRSRSAGRPAVYPHVSRAIQIRKAMSSARLGGVPQMDWL